MTRPPKEPAREQTPPAADSTPQAPQARAARRSHDSTPADSTPQAPQARAARRSRAKSTRLDERVVAAGLAESRSRGQALIRAGRILVDDVPMDKPGTRVPGTARIRLRGSERRFVSRGGEKLAGALEDLGLDPTGLRCLDVGASTGGFTDCLLQNGARHVVAVDVGYGQLAAGLRSDPRVRVLERRNARELEPADLDAPVELICVDVSFISVRLLLPVLARLAPRATLLVLVKPQFEVGRGQVGRGGVVRDPALRQAAADAVAEAATGLGYRPRGRVESRLAGPKGNQEIFLWLEPGPGDSLLSSPD